MELTDKRFVVRLQGLLGVEQEVFVGLGDAADVIAAGADLADRHAVSADKAEDHGPHIYGAASRLAVGDHDAGLHHITRYDLGGQLGVDHLDVHIVVRELAAFVPRLGHLRNDWERDLSDVEVVDASVAVAQKRAGPTVDGADHALLRLLLEPAVDIVCQKVGVLILHPLVILAGDVQVGTDLLMRIVEDLQRFHLVGAAFIQHMQHGRVAPRLHAQGSGVDEVIRFRLALTLDLQAHFLNCESCFHDVFCPFFK